MKRGALWLLALGAGCAAPNFDPVSKVQTVRILATMADRPYATPGDTVNMTLLAYDGRPSRPAPMNLYWLPQPCINPAGDAYYACYATFGSAFPQGVDLGPTLPSGPTFSFPMPMDVIASHKGSRGGDAYGLAIVFAIACAGHVQYAPPAPGGSPDALPMTCVDDTGDALGPDGFVFAYSLVYAFADWTNSNPAITTVTADGSPVDPMAGITIDHCMSANIDDCPSVSLDTVVPPSSQEDDPGDVDAQGHVLKEQIYVDYYLTAGKVKSDTVVLFDSRLGALGGSGDAFRAPQSPGESLLWAVVHDNRGGVAWQTLTVHTR
jgi:hypothetical protein